MPICPLCNQIYQGKPEKCPRCNYTLIAKPIPSVQNCIVPKRWEDVSPKMKKGFAIYFGCVSIILVFVLIYFLTDGFTQTTPYHSSYEPNSYYSRKTEKDATSSFSQDIADKYGVSKETVDSVLDAMTNELNKGN